MTAAVCLMAKKPAAGRVKTRLIPQFGSQRAADLYAAMLSCVREVIETACAAAPADGSGATPSLRPFIAYDPPSDRAPWETWSGWTPIPQKPGDLGSRLMGALESIEKIGPVPVVFLGADCPEINPHHIIEAIQILKQADVAMRPSLDGGYVSIGLWPRARAIFQGINWGTSVVAAQTREVCRQYGLTLSESAPLSDIDEPNDLDALLVRLAQSEDIKLQRLRVDLMSIIA